MRKYHFTMNENNYQRISKAKLYSLARQITSDEIKKLKFVISACNLRPEKFGCMFTFQELNNADTALNDYINLFECHNCMNAETGKYASFYMEVK